MLDLLLRDVQVSMLVFFRVLGLIQVVPLFSSASVPQIAKIGIGLFVASAVVPSIVSEGYPVPERALEYGLLVLGEALIGILLGFVIRLVFSAFRVAGQLFSLQMGFGAAEVFDPLAQIQIPLIGQFFNLIAMFIFLTIGGFHKVMLVGVARSFQVIRAADLVTGRRALLSSFGVSLGNLFETALMISLPILGTLLLVSISLGLLAKAAPQMNLLMLGFPVSIGVGFVVFVLALPFVVGAIAKTIDGGFEELANLIMDLKSEGLR